MPYYVLNALGAVVAVASAPINEDDLQVGWSVVESEEHPTSLLDLETVTPEGILVYRQPAVPTLDELKATRAAYIEGKCAAQIIAGFACDALGEAHTYPSKPTDQANLTASVLDAVLAGDAPGWTTPFWCADAAGVWAWRQHTAVQIKAVGAAGKAAVLTAQAHNAYLQAQIAAATTAAEVEAVTW